MSHIVIALVVFITLLPLGETLMHYQSVMR
ncbi:hypothetical protein DSM3645_22536 [Blastopirellula marina DSM 3645]|uniref:Uncharacterized protein n=1 Tax=Blastopirellula marina DSM 3645 TaxID=314230 RepID=A3ZPU4_9BACT|nr:hypothetical protein DSM3645_22536 [Blastopirellula marina DSM 3645]